MTDQPTHFAGGDGWAMPIQTPCQHDWQNHISTPYKGVYLSRCRKCGETEEYEKDYT